MIGAASDNSRTEPAEARSHSHRVGLALNVPETVRREELAEVLHGLAANARATMGQLIRPDVLFEIFGRIQRATSFKHDNAQPAFGENFRGRDRKSTRLNSSHMSIS